MADIDPQPGTPVTNGYIIGGVTYVVAVPDPLVLNDLVVNNTINGQPIVGDFVFTGAAQTISNKDLIDASTHIVDAVDPTVRINFDAAGAAATTAQVVFEQTADRAYTIIDVPIDCEFVLTEGNQTINGTKTFADMGVINLSVDNIFELTPGHGVNVAEIRIGVLALPAVDPGLFVAEFNPTVSAASANITAAISAKGSGAIVTVEPGYTWTDGITNFVGGDMRGEYAVDLQRWRTVATSIASGFASSILGGAENATAGDYSVVIGGQNNTILVGADWSAVLYGENCSVAGAYSAAGGRGAQPAHDGALVLADSQNTTTTSTVADQFVARFQNGYELTGGGVTATSLTLTAAGGNNAAIALYKESAQTMSFNFFGRRVANRAVLCTRTNAVATITWQQTNANAAPIPANTITFNTAIPAEFRPAAAQTLFIGAGQDSAGNVINTLAIVTVGTDGVVSIAYLGLTPTGGVNQFLPRTTITYNVDAT